MTPRIPRSLALLCLLLLGGCGTAADVRNLGLVYRIDVQQGNVITQEMLAQLRPGMEKSKVRFIMGSPMIVDTFHPDRWDYLYSYQEGKKPREQRRVTLLFKDDKLHRVTGDVRAAEGEIVLPERRDTTVAVEGELDKSLFQRVKDTVGLGDEAAAAAAAGTAAGTQDDEADAADAEEARSFEPTFETDPAGSTEAASAPPADGLDAPPAVEPAEEESFFDRIFRE